MPYNTELESVFKVVQEYTKSLETRGIGHDLRFFDIAPDFMQDMYLRDDKVPEFVCIEKDGFSGKMVNSNPQDHSFVYDSIEPLGAGWSLVFFSSVTRIFS